MRPLQRQGLSDAATARAEKEGDPCLNPRRELKYTFPDLIPRPDLQTAKRLGGGGREKRLKAFELKSARTIKLNSFDVELKPKFSYTRRARCPHTDAHRLLVLRVEKHCRFIT